MAAFCITIDLQNLSFARYVGQTVRNIYGRGTGQIWLDDLACTGYETHLFNCSHAGWGRHNCFHYEDVAISCSSSVHGNISVALYLTLPYSRFFSSEAPDTDSTFFRLSLISCTIFSAVVTSRDVLFMSALSQCVDGGRRLHSLLLILEHFSLVLMAETLQVQIYRSRCFSKRRPPSADILGGKGRLPPTAVGVREVDGESNIIGISAWLHSYCPIHVRRTGRISTTALSLHHVVR